MDQEDTKLFQAFKQFLDNLFDEAPQRAHELYKTQAWVTLANSPEFQRAVHRHNLGREAK